jgi:hypothetical protein
MASKKAFQITKQFGSKQTKLITGPNRFVVGTGYTTAGGTEMMV